MYWKPSVQHYTQVVEAAVQKSGDGQGRRQGGMARVGGRGDGQGRRQGGMARVGGRGGGQGRRQGGWPG